MEINYIIGLTIIYLIGLGNCIVGYKHISKNDKKGEKIYSIQATIFFFIISPISVPVIIGIILQKTMLEK